MKPVKRVKKWTKRAKTNVRRGVWRVRGWFGLVSIKIHPAHYSALFVLWYKLTVNNYTELPRACSCCRVRGREGREEKKRGRATREGGGGTLYSNNPYG